jgi:hypothetical protein
MTQIYPRTADAEFHISATGATLTVRNVPFDWNPRSVGDMDAQGVMAVLRHLRSTGQSHREMGLVWVITTPVREGLDDLAEHAADMQRDKAVAS